jgi:arylsulfatase A-like enzyme
MSIAMNIILFALGAFLFFVILRKNRSAASTKISFFHYFLFYALAIIIFSSFITEHVMPDRKLSDPASVKDMLKSKYNVILIVWDAVRFDHVSAYGYKRKTTPNLDQLAAKGALFENAISQSSHTRESIPSLLSACFPSTHRMNLITDKLPKDLIILPEIFKALKYNTVSFSANPLISPLFGYNEGVDQFFSPSADSIRSERSVFGHLLNLAPSIPVLGLITKPLLKFSSFLYFTDGLLESTDAKTITDKAIRWVTGHQQKPFFMYLHYEGGHAPYIAPKEHQKLFTSNVFNEHEIYFPTNESLYLPFEEGDPLAPQEIENMVAQYDAKIFSHDENLGRLVNHLEKLELIDNTLIVITSDHGEEFYEHKGWAHGHSLYEELIHVPLVFYGPKLISAGWRIKEPVALVDVVPSILSLFGIEKNHIFPYELDGDDISPLLKTKNLDFSEKHIFSELHKGNNSSLSFRGERYKLIDIEYGLERKVMLFDLVVDPLEKEDIAEKHPAKVWLIYLMLRSTKKEAENQTFEPRKRPPLNKNEKKRLKSLGYTK